MFTRTNRHRRIVVLAFAVVLTVILLALAGCSGKQAPTTGEQKQPEQKATEPAPVEKAKEQATPITIRLAHTFNQTNQVYKGAEQFKKNVEERTNGRVKVEVYPANTLFADKDMNQAVQNASIEMGMNAAAWWAEVDSAMSLPELPFLFKSTDDYVQKMQGAVGKKLGESTKQYGVEVIGWVHGGLINGIGNNVRPVKTPEDMKNLKIRSFGDIHVNFLKAMNASPVLMSNAEVYMGLQRGTIDGVYSAAASWRDRKWMEVSKYLTILGPVAFAPIDVMANGKWWAGLPDDIKKIIQEEVDNSGTFTAKLLLELLDEAVNEMKEKTKIEIITVPGSELPAWRKASEPVYEYFGKLAGSRGEELVKMAGQ